MTHDNQTSPSRKALRFLPHVVRVLMGLGFFVFGLNGFLYFIPPPETPLPEEAIAFVTALVESRYMMPLIAATQLIVGALLLLNRFVPLALLLIAPFLVNSLAFHLTLEPSGLVSAIVFSLLEVYLAWAYRAAWRPLFVPRTLPA